MKFHDRTEVPAKFTLAQTSETDLVFTACVPLLSWEHEHRALGVDRLLGELSDGRSVSIDGLIVLYTELNFPLKKTYLTGYASNFVFGTPEFESEASISFELTNFLFMGNEFEKRLSGNIREARRPLLSLRLDGRVITIRQKDEYEKIRIDLEARRGVKVTCTAKTTIKNSSEINEITEMIAGLCDVISIARSTLVNWTSYDVMAQDGRVIFSSYRNSVTRNYSGIALIHYVI